MPCREEKRREGRIITLDLVKGIAIILVVWGHFIQNSFVASDVYYDNLVFMTIYSFHMPLFALVSGYLLWGSLKKHSLKELVISRFRTLLLPITIWSILNWLLSILQHRSVSIELLWETVTGNFLWFLWSVLAAQLVLCVMEKMITDKYKWIGYIIGLFVMYVFPNQELNLFLYPFILVGFLFNKNSLELSKISIGKWCVIPLWIILLFLFRRDCYIYISGISPWKSELEVGRHFVIDIYRYVIGFAGSLSVILIVQRLEGPLFKVRWLAAWGENSMQIYIMQCFVMKLYSIGLALIVNKLGTNPITGNTVVFSIVITPVMALVCTAVLYWVALQIKKIKWLNMLCFGR